MVHTLVTLGHNLITREAFQIIALRISKLILLSQHISVLIPLLLEILFKVRLFKLLEVWSEGLIAISLKRCLH